MEHELRSVLGELGIPQALELLAPHWQQSLASLPDAGPSLLAREQFVWARSFAGLPDEVDDDLARAAQLILNNVALTRFVWHCHELVYRHRDYEPALIGRWPVLDEVLGEDCGLLYLLVALAAVPQMRAVHEERGIPEQISHDTCSHYPAATRVYREAHGGRWGVNPRVLYWLRNHTAGDLYRLGRMEYMIKPFRGRLSAYRHKQSREVVALAADGVRFNAEGYVDADPDESALAGGWQATFEQRPDAVTGCPIAPRGVGLRAQVKLTLDEWEPALAPGDHVLEMHIPEGGGMTVDRCEDSMRRALEFFPRYFPEQPFAGFGCASWILNPQLADIYSPRSNMVLWQNELYLYPYPSGDRSGLYFVFGTEQVDPATAPRDTSLRRALLDHLQAGGRLITGGMFMLTEDFENFGTQHYRSHWPPSMVGDLPSA